MPVAGRRCGTITLPSIRRTFMLVIDHPDRAAVPAVRPGLADDPRRPEQRLTKPIVLYIYDTGFRRWDLG